MKHCFYICHFLLVGGGSLDSAFILTFFYLYGSVANINLFAFKQAPPSLTMLSNNHRSGYLNHGNWAQIH